MEIKDYKEPITYDKTVDTDIYDSKYDVVIYILSDALTYYIHKTRYVNGITSYTTMTRFTISTKADMPIRVSHSMRKNVYE